MSEDKIKIELIDTDNIELVYWQLADQRAEEIRQLRAERDALLDLRDAAQDARTAIETAPVGPGASKLMTLLDALDALAEPTEGAQP